MTKEINNCIETLEKEGLILYPTDTNWAIGCDATNNEAVKKIYALKKRTVNDSLICLVSSQAMLERYVESVPDVAYDIMDLATKPTTIIFDKPKGLADSLITKDNTVAMRVASNKFCEYIINKFGKPIVATSARISNNSNPKKFSAISSEILTGVDYVVNLHQEKENSSPSSIIKLTNDGFVKVIRE